jgi:hypothetical protein
VITNASRTIALSNLGWIDRGSLWLYERANEQRAPQHLQLSDAAYLQLHDGDGKTFAVTHHFHGKRLVVSAHDFGAPDQPTATIDVRGWEPEVTGDLSAFDRTERAFVGYLDDDATGAGGYFLIDIIEGRTQVRRLDWFDDSRYDHGYQSVLSVLRLPELGYLFSVQRSSHLVLCDPDTLEVVSRTALAGRHGNPDPIIHPGVRKLLAIDYDTVVRLDAATLNLEATWFGQEAPAGTAMFLGGMTVGDAPGSATVARPGSGDVVSLDLTTMTPTHSWRVGGEPLEAVELRDQLVARDWKSGALLSAS